jgi:site-specific DNA-methyltransferase (adenine-specific)
MSQVVKKANRNDNGISRKLGAASTVGRGKAVSLNSEPTFTQWKDSYISLFYGDSLEYYAQWETPTVIVSDGGYGVLGFEGDTSDHLNLPEWYEPHIEQWAKYATPQTTLWFWNSEIGWASVHPVLEKYGWRYINCNIWNKGKGHIAGNVNTQKIRRFPVVTEVCVQYVFEPRIDGMPLKEWLLSEWKRTGLPRKQANEACGVKDVATRKYFDQGHLWYFPPPEMFEKLSIYANKYGNTEGIPYFSHNGKAPMSKEEWAAMRSKFYCPHGYTNVWERNALHGKERIRINSNKAVHLNQKPLDLMSMIIAASSDVGDVVWEPFGGLFTASVAARNLGRSAFAAEIDWTYFFYGVQRVKEVTNQLALL